MIKFARDYGGREDYFPVQYNKKKRKAEMPKKDLTGDGVIRAIAIFTGLDYMKVWNDLHILSKSMLFLPNCPEVYETYLTALGFSKHKPIRDSRGKTIEVRKLEKWLLPYGYLIHTTNHLTAITYNHPMGEHTRRDSWDCGRSRANSYWVYNTGGISDDDLMNVEYLMMDMIAKLNDRIYAIESIRSSDGDES